MMRKIFALVLLCGFTLPLFAKTVPEMQKDGWTLTFSDEFDGPKLDLSKWVTHYFFPQIINNELQAYIPGAFVLDNGILHIVAKHEHGFQDGKMQAYTSGVMTTDEKFSQRYGYFEMRCKLPKGQGFWPAFWLLTDTEVWPPEIDIFENLGHENNILHFTNHWRNKDSTLGADSQPRTGPDYTTGFHTIGFDWEPDRLVWYVDDHEQCRMTDHIPNERMYVLINLAVGGAWPKSPDATTPFPSSFDIDYVRVYQKPRPAQ
jgi:beta-glucanase (GH16 family)